MLELDRSPQGASSIRTSWFQLRLCPSQQCWYGWSFGPLWR